MAKEDTWEPRENLKNARDLVKRFKEEYSKKVMKSQIEENYQVGI